MTEVSNFRTNDAGICADQQQASIRRVARVNWQDVSRLKNGEVIILFGGRRIYARLFYADVKPQGAMRVRQGLTGVGVIGPGGDRAEAVAAKIIAGMDIVWPEEPCDTPEPVIVQALTAFAAALALGLTPAEEIKRILDAVTVTQTATIQSADFNDATGPTVSGQPWHPFGAILASVTEPDRRPHPSPIQGASHNPDLVNLIMAIEVQTGASPADARFAALSLLDSLGQGSKSDAKPV